MHWLGDWREPRGPVRGPGLQMHPLLRGGFGVVVESPHLVLGERLGPRDNGPLHGHHSPSSLAW